MSEEEESYNVGAILRNKYTGATLEIVNREMTEYGSIGYNVQKEGVAWTDWEGGYSLSKNWEQISDPMETYNEGMRIELLKFIQETTHEDIVGLWHKIVPHPEEEEE